MVNHYFSIRKALTALYIALCLLLSALMTNAQTYVTGPITGTPAAGDYYNSTSIAVNAPFSFVPSAGQRLHLYIAPPDCVLLATAASTDQNYILTSTPRVGGIVNAGGLANRGTCDLMQAIQYFDGLGRPLQTVQIKASPGDKDIVQPVAYDQFGREATKYLPYTATSADGSYKTDALTTLAGQSQFYNPTNSSTLTQQPNGVVNTSYPSATTVFEPSPLNRVTEQGAPGLSWQPGIGHTAKVAYGTNATGEVIQWAANTAGNGLTGGNTFYAAGVLYATTTTDENGYSSIEYKDVDGRIVCKKEQLTTTAGSYVATYYVYNDLNNLSYVIPPNPSGASYPANILETDAVFTNFLYGYHYDERSRLIQKKIPGKGTQWEYVVFNKLNQLVLSQDALQRVNNQWTVIKYDAFGRVIMTGLWNAGSAIAQNTLQTSIYAGAQWDTRDYTDNIDGYNITSYPATLTKILSINYYDDYNNIPGKPSDFPVSGYSPMTAGLLTATKTAVLNSATDMLCTMHYYDDLGRTIKTYQQHYLGGALSPYNYDIVSNVYDFTNEVTATTRQHYTKNAGNTAAVLGVTVANAYTYDHAGRQTQTKEQINTGSNILLSQTDYNEIGQVTAKHLHGATGAAPFLQDISYKYNERGWLKSINDPTIAPTGARLFSEQLNYDVVNFGTVPNYNGNITEQLFQVYGSTYSGQQHVVYTYDPLNRLNSGISSTTLNETGITYDNLGNITSLTRDANTGTYSYAGNQLNTVSGITTSNYVYDVNGNVSHDGRTGVTVTYNLLDLPQTIIGTNINITYTYDAGGQKLRKVSTSSSGTTNTDYINGIQYKTDGATIDFIQTEEGRAINNAGAYTYEYTLTDHLGNNRVTFDQTNGKVGEEDYYPFGLNTHRLVNGTNKYLYNKKEIQEELTEYDYGARFYDPVTARWTSVDPLAEKDRRWSPYNYVLNNPVKLVDPDGMGHFDPKTGNWIADVTDDATYRFDENGGSTVTSRGQTFTWMGKDQGWVAEDKLSDSQLEDMYWRSSDAGENPFQGAYGNQLHEWATSSAGMRSGIKRNSRQLNFAADVAYVTANVAMPAGGAAAEGEGLISKGLSKLFGKLGSKVEYINLASIERTAHIIEADAIGPGGGHAWFGSLKSFMNGITGAKTMFPITWSKGQIMEAISDVAVNNNWVQQSGKIGATLTKGGAPVKYVVEGIYQGIKIRVITTATDIVTAFPIK